MFGAYPSVTSRDFQYKWNICAVVRWPLNGVLENDITGCIISECVQTSSVETISLVCPCMRVVVTEYEMLNKMCERENESPDAFHDCSAFILWVPVELIQLGMCRLKLISDCEVHCLESNRLYRPVLAERVALKVVGYSSVANTAELFKKTVRFSEQICWDSIVILSDTFCKL